MPVNHTWKPRTAILELGDEFYDQVRAAGFPQQILRWRNDRQAATIGLETLRDEEWLEHFGAFKALPGTLQEPLALRYHGHQFRNYNPQLGDGRGFLFAQCVSATDDRLLDLGTKGSGQTPWSRSGDGRLTLKGGIRELLATELLEARGVNTSKTLSLIETGEKLQRGDEPSPTRSCVMVRLSHSHIRFGTFQRLLATRNEEALKTLLHYCVRHYYPGLDGSDESGLPAAFLRAVLQAKARTVAGWMSAGFVHGVLNTDNMNVTGESFDYGPWRFLPHLDTGFTAAYFDHGGLYAYGRQPSAVLWNLARLAECLLPFADKEELSAILEEFEAHVTSSWEAQLAWVLGVTPPNDRGSSELLFATLGFLESSQVPFDGFLADWYGGYASRDHALRSERAHYYEGEAFERFETALQDAKAFAPPPTDEQRVTLLRSSLHIDEVERLWAAIDQQDDWKPLYQKVEDIRAAGAILGATRRSPALLAPKHR